MTVENSGASDSTEASRARQRGGGPRWAGLALLIWGSTSVGVVVVSYFLVQVVLQVGSLTVEQALLLVGVIAVVGVVGALIATYILVRRDAPEERVRVRTQIWQYVILGFLPMLVLAMGFFLYQFVASGNQQNEAAGVAILLIAGVIALLLALAVVAVFFHGLALNDKGEPLGLPTGSIRSVIALALILIFAIMSVYLFSQLDTTVTPAQADIAKQLITTVSTLVVAISAFYFGSNAVQQATNTVAGTKPAGSIRVVGPSDPSITPQAGGSWVPAVLEFQVVTQPVQAQVLGTVGGDDASSLSNVAGVWTYRPTSPSGDVVLRFALAEQPTIFEEIAIAINADQGDRDAAAQRSGGGTTSSRSQARGSSGKASREVAPPFNQ
jgi:hypothetical protein